MTEDDYEMRITPERITYLGKYEVFVFGSNEAGIHGAGAAKQALRWNAIPGYGEGHYGKTYAIPTKDSNIDTLPLDMIQEYILTFIEYAKSNRNILFYVTAIGCGLAGYFPEDIAPLFKTAIEVDNIMLPESFWQLLESTEDL